MTFVPEVSSEEKKELADIFWREAGRYGLDRDSAPDWLNDNSYAFWVGLVAVAVEGARMQHEAATKADPNERIAQMAAVLAAVARARRLGLYDDDPAWGAIDFDLENMGYAREEK